MKNIFIVNPKAGDANCIDKIKKALRDKNGDSDYLIYQTIEPKDATRFVKEYLKNNPSEKIRFYSCGGDGTLNEVANGVVGYPNVSITSYPCGSGNDFIKVFGNKTKFLDIEKLLSAEEKEIDIIKINDYYCLNICNFGFDAVVGKTANEVKLKGGKNPYGAGVLKAILTGMKHKVTVETDGQVLNKKKAMLLCTIANGSYVGGQFYCAPKSKIDDGLIDFCLIDQISIIKVLSILKPYTAGQHLDNPKYEKKVHYKQSKKAKITAEKDFDICIDGEMVCGNNFEVEILPKAIKFAVPKD